MGSLGCICTLTTVADCVVPRYGVTLMSSNEYRSVDVLLPQFQRHGESNGASDETMRGTGLSAASNYGHFARAGLPSGGGGGHGERGRPAGRTGAGRAGAPPGRGGHRAAV